MAHEDLDEVEEAVEYRKLSTRELLVLADKGDEDAEAELERRRHILRD